MKRTTTAATVVLMLLLVLGATPTLAQGQPAGSGGQARTIDLVCDGVAVDVTVNGAGAAAHIIGSNAVLVAQVFEFELVADGAILFSETTPSGQKRGLQDRLVVCTFTEVPSDAEQAEIREFFGLVDDADIVANITVLALAPGSR